MAVISEASPPHSVEFFDQPLQGPLAAGRHRYLEDGAIGTVGAEVHDAGKARRIGALEQRPGVAGVLVGCKQVEVQVGECGRHGGVVVVARLPAVGRPVRQQRSRRGDGRPGDAVRSPLGVNEGRGEVEQVANRPDGIEVGLDEDRHRRSAPVEVLLQEVEGLHRLGILRQEGLSREGRFEIGGGDCGEDRDDDDTAQDRQRAVHDGCRDAPQDRSGAGDRVGDGSGRRFLSLGLTPTVQSQPCGRHEVGHHDPTGDEADAGDDAEVDHRLELARQVGEQAHGGGAGREQDRYARGPDRATHGPAGPIRTRFVAVERQRLPVATGDL